MMETLGALINSKNSKKMIQDDSGRPSILGTPICTLVCTLGGDRVRILIIFMI